MNKLLNMSRVLKLGLTNNNNQKIKEVSSFDVIANKGVIGDRHFKDYNEPFNQLSIIESESIDEYNFKNKLKIPHLNFRRNIVTKGIGLNDLVEKRIKIGLVILEVIDLCRPCRHLSEKLIRNDIIKEFLRKGGIRCQIINNGKISVGDEIKII